MNRPTFLGQVPMFPGSSFSVLGAPLPRPANLAAGTMVRRGKLPLGLFSGRPVLVVDESLGPIGACGETDVRVSFKIPAEYLDAPNVGGTVIQQTTLGWSISDCITGRVIDSQPLETFWEGFEVLPGKDDTNVVDEWWLNAPPAGDGTVGWAQWKGTAAFFPGLTAIACGLSKAGDPDAHPLSGNRPSSKRPPSCWARGPLPESNPATRYLSRLWVCCAGKPRIDEHPYQVFDISNRWVLPEEPDESGLLTDRQMRNRLGLGLDKSGPIFG